MISYEWIDTTLHTIIGTDITVTYNFPVGDTHVQLTVVDNSGDSATDSLTVTVLPSGNQGLYIYFYDLVGLDIGDGVIPTVARPVFAMSVPNLIFPKLSSFPPVSFLSRGPFAVRVVGDILAVLDDDYTFFIAHGGMAVEMKVNDETLLSKMSMPSADVFSVAKPINLKKGRYPLDITYFTPDPSKAQLVLGISLSGSVQQVPDTFLSYDMAVVIPTLHKISPDKATLGGGGHMTLLGAGFTIDSSVRIGPYDVEEIYVKSDSEIHIKIPQAAAPADVLVEVTSPRGVSNKVHFSYTPEALMPIKFRELYLTHANGSNYPSQQFTSVAIGPDLRYYFGSLDTHIYVLTVSHKDLVVTDTCKSKSAGASRSITGVSFNPADISIRVYISTNSFYWRNWNVLSDEDGWHNGKIETFVQGEDSDNQDVCLVYEKDIVTGLPVSNHDHGVNSLVWDNDGNLYAQIGGNTNGGISKPDDLVGGVPESVMSAATVVIHLQEPGFDGAIRYTKYDDPATAKKITSDKFVECFAYGFRNSYGSVFHTNGHIYATDNGPNKGYGQKSLSCTEEGPDPWHPDTLVLVHKDGYFGFPNRARGKAGDERQCVYYGPTETSRNGFTAALATFEASTNGVAEYTANCFEGQLRGDLLVSKYAVAGSGKLFRVSLDATGTALVGDVTEIAQYSGLSIAMNPFGSLIMPRVQQPNIAVLQPDEEEYEDEGPRIIAVIPHRGPMGGGNPVSITGENFVEGSKVMFGSSPCEIHERSSRNDWILCKVPPGSGAVKVVVTTPNGMTTTIREDYYYLNL